MVKKFSKVVEKGSGEGKLFSESELLDDVSYKFEKSPEYIISESFSDTQTLEGQPIINGNLTLKNKMIDIAGKNNLKLVLSDNQTWNISIPDGDFINREYRFRVFSID